MGFACDSWVGTSFSSRREGEPHEEDKLVSSSAEGHSSLDRDTSVLSSTLACEQAKTMLLIKTTLLIVPILRRQSQIELLTISQVI